MQGDIPCYGKNNPLNKLKPVFIFTEHMHVHLLK